MVKAAYADCFSGASGDMFLGALIDAGLPIDELRDGLASLPLPGWRLDMEPVEQHGVHGSHVRVELDPDLPQPARHLSDVEDIISSARLPAAVTQAARLVFRRLGEAEARVHRTALEEVHFHEVGAVDAIIDIVGSVLGLHILGIDAENLFSSPLPLGSGWIRSAHGRLPAPGPAVAELMRISGAPTRPAPTEEPTGELVTPTGAALLTTLARFRQPSFGTVQAVGYGFGTRAPAWPNALRLWIGETADSPLQSDAVVQIETNIDDTTPEQLGFAMEELLAAGALDVAFSPLQMKKNRPGVLLRVLSQDNRVDELTRLVFRHTSTLGVRLLRAERRIAERTTRTVHTPWGEISVKERHIGNETVSSPEYEDCARAARRHGVPLGAVYEAALRSLSDSTLRSKDEGSASGSS